MVINRRMGEKRKPQELAVLSQILASGASYQECDRTGELLSNVPYVAQPAISVMQIGDPVLAI